MNLFDEFRRSITPIKIESVALEADETAQPLTLDVPEELVSLEQD
jgi:hypothetical protein